MAPKDEDFVALAEKLGYDLSEYDLMIVCDGSGTVLDKPCGYYAAAYNRSDKKVLEYHGAASVGTNNYAELFPFLLALGHDYGKFGRQDTRVLCVTDSELTARCGAGMYTRNANRALWAQLEWYQQKGGYELHWEWVPRNSNPLNEIADQESRKARHNMEGLLAQS